MGVKGVAFASRYEDGTRSPQSRREHRSQRSNRQIKPLPAQILDHCSICLEEQLFSQAFSLLSNALTSGSGLTSATYVPPVQHLALAATLIVHPKLTTRTTAPEKHAAADDALHYLIAVVKLLGSCDAELAKAFDFVGKSQSTSRSKRAANRRSALTVECGAADDAKLRSPYVDGDALWTNADDFWSVVGWALNCSVAHKHRWERWKVWLDLMLCVLDDDLQGHMATGSVSESLLAHYLHPIGEGRNNKRRLMRAILADGKQRSLAEFHEIWPNETKLPMEKDNDTRIGKKRKLDLDNNDFGDYYDNSDADSPDDSLQESMSATGFFKGARSRHGPDDWSARDASDDDTTASILMEDKDSGSRSINAFGGIESIHVRQRFLAMLIALCHHDPTAFLDTEDLFDLLTEFLRPLPLPVFQQFVLPTTTYLDPDAHSSLNQMLLRALLSNNAPAYDENALTQDDFETHYAPYPANTTGVTDNAKVSLIIEDLLRLLWHSGKLAPSEKLRNAVEAGNDARREKVISGGRRKTGAKVVDAEEAVATLEHSAERMRLCVAMLA
ncbi:hypothetical protein BAUCODRAFT_276078 [Baudoinia panamericana UAMH 10762]|uniref:Uncharacterized protein n=1 Tax=Baudoinia panamericana (strain UAMH 10762) TaxID=717646 RepID=M2M728_BAUPA|nr:uncharacterized protein BAUCODRAFT_276078 [Baudoinia panamericana UAMH 10762]EMC92096.1 hypothetical protein BAUCODRAFT_276078 [Baudoinia panamericana UAMH 10762]